MGRIVPVGREEANVSEPMQADLHLWLEEVDGERALAWVESENETTFAELQADPRYERIRGAALELLDADDRIRLVEVLADSTPLQ